MRSYLGTRDVFYSHFWFKVGQHLFSPTIPELSAVSLESTAYQYVRRCAKMNHHVQQYCSFSNPKFDKHMYLYVYTHVFFVCLFLCWPGQVLYPGNYLPSLTHRFIKELETRGKLLRNFTQNIDGLGEGNRAACRVVFSMLVGSIAIFLHVNAG